MSASQLRSHSQSTTTTPTPSSKKRVFQAQQQPPSEPDSEKPPASKLRRTLFIRDADDPPSTGKRYHNLLRDDKDSEQEDESAVIRQMEFLDDADDEPPVMRKRNRVVVEDEGDDDDGKALQTLSQPRNETQNVNRRETTDTDVNMKEPINNGGNGDDDDDDQPLVSSDRKAIQSPTRHRFVAPKPKPSFSAMLSSRAQPSTVKKSLNVFNLTQPNNVTTPKNHVDTEKGKHMEEAKSMDLSNDLASSTGTGSTRVSVFQFTSSGRSSTNADSQASGSALSKLPPKVLKDMATTRGGLMMLSDAPNQGNNGNGDAAGRGGEQVEDWCSKHNWSVDVRDSEGRRLDHAEYDGTTLYIPPEELSDAKGAKSMSAFQKQFWKIKKDHYDVVLMIKKGKFYELYDKDADIGNSVLGLNYTKGGRVDMRCCGVPEQAFDKHCLRLIDLGYKVGRVEQTETANAAEQRKKKNMNSSSVCERTLVRIYTKATIREEAMLRDHNPRYVVAIAQKQVDGSSPNSDVDTVIGDEENGDYSKLPIKIGLAFVDVASGSINISEFDDDERLVRTERLITCLAPAELIVDYSAMCRRLTNIVKWCGRKFQSVVKDVGPKGGFRPVSDSVLSSYLLHTVNNKDADRLLQRLRLHANEYKTSGKAFGGLVSHLKSLIIDKETLSLANYSLFPEPNEDQKMFDEKGETNEDLLSHVDTILPFNGDSAQKLYMDASALQNLEVLTSTMGTENGSLLSFVDRAQTPAGRRLLRRWIAEPLASKADIEDRLQAVDDLHAVEDLDGGRLLQRICKLLKSKKDLERALPKIHQFATVEDGAVMFDDTNKRRVRDFVSVLHTVHDCLKGLETLAEALEETKQHATNASDQSSDHNKNSRRLSWLCTPGGGVPSDALDKISFFLGEAFDIGHAEAEGEIIPTRGAVLSYDQARGGLDKIDKSLDAELDKWKRTLNDRSIKFYHRGKEPYQVEIKKDCLKRMGSLPNEFDVMSESKTTQRFYTSRIRRLVNERVGASEAVERETAGIAREMAGQFNKHFSTWLAVSRAAAEVDALIGLSRTSRTPGMTRPTVLSEHHEHAVFHATGLRHAILAASSASDFVPNDVRMGKGGDTDVMILTGPNAGGKSTLSRQVGLAVLLAQMGCYVPAESLTLRPFRDVFVRMGASDEIARGRSTFMVEMEEVSQMLNQATDRSLIIADEVGRGTSTHDGYAIASAVIDHIARVNRSLTLFSTHYLNLANDVATTGGCHVTPAATTTRTTLRCGAYQMAALVDEKSKRITFLYKLDKGASPHSRGVYCARVAGITDTIADWAEKVAGQFDCDMKLNAVCHELQTLLKLAVVEDVEALLVK